MSIFGKIASLFEGKKAFLQQAADFMNAKYPSKPVALSVKDTYYNMKERILPKWEIITLMEEAMRENGVEPVALPIRGGTDGARLSYLGLPCPNVCTGGANFHGKLEYAVLEDMAKIKDILKTAIENIYKGRVLFSGMVPSVPAGLPTNIFTETLTAACGNCLPFIPAPGNGARNMPASTGFPGCLPILRKWPIPRSWMPYISPAPTCFTMTTARPSCKEANM